MTGSDVLVHDGPFRPPSASASPAALLLFLTLAASQHAAVVDGAAPRNSFLPAVVAGEPVNRMMLLDVNAETNCSTEKVPCNDHGQCDPVSGTCTRCYSPFGGENCGTCLCEHGGTCRYDIIDGVYACDCTVHYTGPFCASCNGPKLPGMNCTTLTCGCENGGKCRQIVGNTYTCDCKIPFHGKFGGRSVVLLLCVFGQNIYPHTHTHTHTHRPLSTVYT